jgi:hypothetical protein
MTKLALTVASILFAVLFVGVSGCARAKPIISTTYLPDGEINIAYSQMLAASGGTGGYNWSVTSGTLPDGLSLDSSTGVIGGTPNTAGVYSFTVRVTDSNGDSENATLSITIQPPPSIDVTSLPDGEVNGAYAQFPIEISGGSGNYSDWSIKSGNLPGGLSLGSADGVIFGKPTTAGTFSFTIQVTDSNGVTATQALSITIVAAPSITTTSLPDGEVNIAYSQTLGAIGGSGDYSSWAITSGTLPAGLSLDASTGVINGTPTTAGVSSIIIQLTDSGGSVTTQALSITIVP